MSAGHAPALGGHARTSRRAIRFHIGGAGALLGLLGLARRKPLDRAVALPMPDPLPIDSAVEALEDAAAEVRDDVAVWQADESGGGMASCSVLAGGENVAVQGFVTAEQTPGARLADYLLDAGVSGTRIFFNVI